MVTTSRRRSLKKLTLLAAATMMVGTLASPAWAQVAADPPAAGPTVNPITALGATRSPVIFPERDFIVLEGYKPGADHEVRVVRDGVTIGTGTGKTDAAGLLEINHPGGVCWGTKDQNGVYTGSTPDILPGDVIDLVETNGPGTDDDVIDRLVTQDVTAEAAEIVDGKLVIRGNAARSADGTRFDLTKVEQRIINPDFTTSVVGRRDISVNGDGTSRVPAGTTASLAYDGPNSTTWTATYTGLGQEVMDLAVAGQTRVLSWMAADAAGNRLGITIYEAGELGGPGFGGCPASAKYAVTGSDHAPGVNIANVGQDLVLSGVSTDASAVSVSLDDEDPNTPAIADVQVDAASKLTPGPGSQTWWVSIPADKVAGLSDGTLTASARYTVSGAPEAINGAKLRMSKDTKRPLEPQASPGPGTYFNDAQSVTLDNPENSPDPDAKIYHEIDAAPTSKTRGFVNPPPILVEKSQTINARAIDAAGNKSAIQPFRYVISDNIKPVAPTAVDLAAASDSGSSSTDNITNNITPTFSGAAEPRSNVQIFDGTSVVGSGTAGADGKFSITTSTLAEGVRSITARATDPTGNVSDASAPFSLTVDTTAPNTSITSGPSATVNVITASFGFASTEPQDARFRCSLDGAAFTACASPSALAGLAPNRSHNFRVQSTDAAGNLDASPAAHNWTIDTVRPTVTRTTPSNGARNIAVRASVTATFSEPMANVTGTTFTLRRGTQSVPAVISYNAATRTATLNPSANLVRGATYTATIRTAVTDSAGNTMAANKTFSFRVVL